MRRRSGSKHCNDFTVTIKWLYSLCCGIYVGGYQREQLIYLLMSSDLISPMTPLQLTTRNAGGEATTDS